MIGSRTATLAATLLAATASASAAECSLEAAERLVRTFYAPKGHESGVPSLGQLATTTRPYTRRLHWLLVGAAKYREDFIRKYPPVWQDGAMTAPKPPFVDGDPFGEWMDGGKPDLQQLEFREAGAAGWEARVRSKPGTGSPWKITVRVAEEEGACAIDDVVYEDGTLLSTSLAWRGDPTL